MNRPVEVVRDAVWAFRERLSAVAGQPARTILLGTILLASAVSAATGYVLAQYYSLDVLSALVSIPEDCWFDWGPHIGRHCFSDYEFSVSFGMRANPWEPYPRFVRADNQPIPNNYPPAGMVPEMAFGLLGKWLRAPQLGLLGYLLALTAAVLTPAVWATRGARGLERVVVFVTLGAAAIPVWTVVNGGNPVGFVAPIALVFLVALCRQRWGLVTVMVVLAALVKPQFVVLAVALFAARKWRLGAIAVAGSVVTNFAAYLLWPSDFPATIMQSLHSILGYGFFGSVAGLRNVSFGRGLMLIPDTINAYQLRASVPEGFLAGPRSVIGYVVLVIVVVCVVALGRRIPPVMAGIVLLATASLFPALAADHYLIFVVPIAALIARDPDGPPGSGIFDRLAVVGGHRRAVGIAVSLATALSIAQIAISTQPIREPILGQHGVIGVVGSRTLAMTTVGLTPIFWLLACAIIIVSYTRRPARSAMR